MSRRTLCAVGVVCVGWLWSTTAWGQLLAHYDFEQASATVVADGSGKGNDGTLAVAGQYDTPGDPNWTTGQVGAQALNFDGTLAVVLPAESMGLRSDTGSVAFWLYMGDTMQGGINTIWWGGDNQTGGGFGPENEMHIHVEAPVGGIWQGGEIAFHGQNTPNNFHLFSDPNKGNDPATEPNSPILMVDNQWHHIVCTWGSADGNVKLYHNGVLLHQGAQGVRNFPLSFMVLGCMANGGRTLYGTLDDVQIYGRALTDAEVTEVMNAGLALTLPASLPSPAHRITEVALDAPLSWVPGDTAASHNIYFGTSFEDVNAATADDPRGVLVAQGHGETSYDPGALAYLTTYYWRVDEVEADGVTIHRGSVWQFTTRNFIVVDDFESYTDDEGQRIYESWIDGWDVADNGAIVGYETAPFAETENIHSGLQAMPLSFDTDHKYVETYLDLPADRQDWTAGGVQDLSLWFMGYKALTGSYTEDSPTEFTVRAAGADIWGGYDECYFVYKELTGNSSIVARIDSLVDTHAFAKAGVMVRDTLDPGAKNTAVFFTPGNGTRLQRRNAADAAYLTGDETTLYMGDPNDPNTFPRWVKIERSAGGLIRAYTSVNGTAWDQFPLARTLVIMSNPVYVGLAVTSHDAAVVTEAHFSGVAITGNGSDAPWTGVDIGVLNNPAEPIFVALNDQAVVYHPDPNAAQTDGWSQWNIPLQQFADQGVNLGAVTRLTLGVGTRRDTASPGGQGTLFIDDIRLYRPSTPQPITVENFSFELPGTGKHTDFNEVPGWSTDGPLTDSGIDVDAASSEGQYATYWMAADPPLWQLTDHVLAAGDELRLLVDARLTWLATTLRMTLYVLDDDGQRMAVASRDVPITDTMTEVSLDFKANDVREAIGRAIGIELANASAEPNSWLSVDNVRLILTATH